MLFDFNLLLLLDSFNQWLDLDLMLLFNLLNLLLFGRKGFIELSALPLELFKKRLYLCFVLLLLEFDSFLERLDSCVSLFLLALDFRIVFEKRSHIRILLLFALLDSLFDRLSAALLLLLEHALIAREETRGLPLALHIFDDELKELRESAIARAVQLGSALFKHFCIDNLNQAQRNLLIHEVGDVS